MKKEANIIESVEFLAEEDLLVAELDKRLSFTTVDVGNKACEGFLGCKCFGHEAFCRCVNQAGAPSQPSAVRG